MTREEWISNYWVLEGKTYLDKLPGKTFVSADGSLGCDECCTEPWCESHYHRPYCPYCLGSGSGTNATTNTESVAE